MTKERLSDSKDLGVKNNFNSLILEVLKMKEDTIKQFVLQTPILKLLIAMIAI